MVEIDYLKNNIMVKDTELRKGNFLYVDKDIITEVTVIGEDYLGTTKTIGFINIELFSPIPLTPEILEICGFKYIETEVYGYCDKNHVIYQHKNDEWGFNIFCANDEDCTITIKYLHQLQNLYFALTGEELPIKLEIPT